MWGINIQKYSNVFYEERVFSYAGCLSLSGFDEISEDAFEAGTSPPEKAKQERKRSMNVYALMLRVLSCVLQSGKVKLFLEVEMKKESAVSGSQNVREGVTASREYIWAILVIWSAPNARDKIKDADVVASTNHVTFQINRFSRLISLSTSTIFVSGTSGITAILKISECKSYNVLVDV